MIPAKANRKQPIPHDTITYALRNRIERCFAKLKCSRRLATRYDKTSASYLGFIHMPLRASGPISLSTGPRVISVIHSAATMPTFSLKMKNNEVPAPTIGFDDIADWAMHFRRNSRQKHDSLVDQFDARKNSGPFDITRRDAAECPDRVRCRR